MFRPVRTCPAAPASAATRAAASCAPTRRHRILILLVAALLAGAPALEATTYNLITTVDDAVTNGNCTLREALRAAATNSALDACPAGGLNDAIVLPSGTYPFNGEETISDSGTLSITGATLNPFNVSVNLGNVGRFVSFAGGGAFTVAGIEFTNGKAAGGDGRGGVIHADNVALTLFNFRLLSSFGGDSGGAVYYVSTGVPKALLVRNGTFQSNSVLSGPTSFSGGGAVSVTIMNGSDADFRDVAFLSNFATAGSASGGGLSLLASGSGSVGGCVRCTFQNNYVTGEPTGSSNGGAVGLWAENNARLTLQDSRFIGNFASSTFNRTFVLYAGATSGATVDLDRLFIDFNSGSASTSSQDVSLYVTTGALLWMVDSQLTFGAANGLTATVESGGGLHLGHLTIADYPGDGARFLGTSAGPALLQSSLVTFNGGTDLVDGDGMLAQTGNNIGGDPLFVNQPSGDYHLSSASPAIDFGTPGALTLRLADLDHGARQVGLAPDIGCYEFNALFADGFDVGDPGSWSSFVP